MKLLWNEEKNDWLKENRNVSFEMIEEAISKADFVEAGQHPNQKKYPNQEMLVVKLAGYPYCVPYIRRDDIIFLKTIYPSRKAKKMIGITK